MNNSQKNLTMIMDLYELTMSNGIFDSEMRDETVYFDMFFRRVPDDGGYAVMAGIEQLIEYMNNLEFDESDIAYLKGLKLFSEDFIEYLRTFKFTCDVWAMPEGTVIFPHEPIVTVRGPAMQAMMLETMLLLTINHQSLIATKANRIVRAAAGYGIRRTQSARLRRGILRRKGGGYRRLHGHLVHTYRKGFRRSGFGYNGAQLGTAFRR